MKKKIDKTKVILWIILIPLLAAYIIIMMKDASKHSWCIGPDDAFNFDSAAFCGFICLSISFSMKNIFRTDMLSGKKRMFILAAMVIFLIAAIFSVYCVVSDRYVHVIFRLITLALFIAVAVIFPYAPRADIDDDE